MVTREEHGVPAVSVYQALYSNVGLVIIKQRVKVHKVPLPTVAGIKYIQTVDQLSAFVHSLHLRKPVAEVISAKQEVLQIYTSCLAGFIPPLPVSAENAGDTATRPSSSVTAATLRTQDWSLYLANAWEWGYSRPLHKTIRTN